MNSITFPPSGYSATQTSPGVWTFTFDTTGWAAGTYTLNAAAVDALAEGPVRQRLADIGQEIFPREQQTPRALRALQKAEIEKWWPIIKAANIRAE